LPTGVNYSYPPGPVNMNVNFVTYLKVRSYENQEKNWGFFPHYCEGGGVGWFRSNPKGSCVGGRMTKLE
jgi:hypothetical protein